MIKVVVTDYSFPSLDVETAILQPLGCEIIGHKPIVSPAELAVLVAEADYVVTQFAPVNAEVIAAMRRAKVIVRYGVGVDNVDLAAARDRGIPVCNIPTFCLDEVADHTLALILATTRHVVAHCVGIRNGRWSLAVPLAEMKALRDLTVGVVGFGRIGREVVGRLLAFKCRVLVYDPVVPAGQISAMGCEPASLEDLLRESDLVTLHCPSTPQTRRMMNRTAIAQMKPGAILINVGRGDLVESAALVEALERGHLSAAGLDVFDPEPIPSDSPLLRMDNVVISPHNASASVNAARKLREGVGSIVAQAIRGEALPNIVNGVSAARS